MGLGRIRAKSGWNSPRRPGRDAEKVKSIEQKRTKGTKGEAECG